MKELYVGGLNEFFGIEGPDYILMDESAFTPIDSGWTRTEEFKQSVTGSGNGKSKNWRITFSDGRQIERCGLTNWCKENGYNKAKVSSLYHKREGRTKHKDIIKVECVGE